jgi:hypothetical protein
MNTLEREIIEKFQQLAPDAKQRVRAYIEQEIGETTEQAGDTEFDYERWMRDVKALRQEIFASQGHKRTPIDVVGMLREIRDGEDE